MNVIEANNLTKIYRTAKVVDNVSLKISKGEIYGFLGLNGAGKTTTMRIILGMIKPTKGSVLLFGKEIKKFNWQNVGYMIESTHAYPDLSVFENLKLFYRYYGLKDKQAISKTMSLLNIERYKDTKAAHLSLGNLQRLGLAKALLHEPDVLILDEPVNGLDPAGIVEVRQLLKELGVKGVTVLISSHLLSEISRIADKIGIIHEGRLIREVESGGWHGELERKLIVDTTNNKEAMSFLKNQEIEAILNTENEIEITDTDIISKPECISQLLAHQRLAPRKIFQYEEDLESYFLRIISPKKQ